MATAERPRERTRRTNRRSKTLKLDLGCGTRPQEGFSGVDIWPGEGVEHVVDLFQFPWPFADRSVREAVSIHLIEHIPHYRPEYGGVDGFFMFFNELHRICQKNAKVVLVCPYGKSDRGIWDPSHTRLIHEVTFYYLDQNWLAREGLQQYPVTCNFEVVTMDGIGVPDEIMNRNLEMQNQARSWYWNTVADLRVELKAIK